MRGEMQGCCWWEERTRVSTCPISDTPPTSIHSRNTAGDMLLADKRSQRARVDMGQGLQLRHVRAVGCGFELVVPPSFHSQLLTVSRQTILMGTSS